MKNYQTLISGFIEELNRSPLAYTEKKLINEIIENLVFNVNYSDSSFHRNRPAFLLSLYGTLRWQGGYLPSLHGFLIDIRGIDNRLNSLDEISALFTQALIK